MCVSHADRDKYWVMSTPSVLEPAFRHCCPPSVVVMVERPPAHFSRSLLSQRRGDTHTERERRRYICVSARRGRREGEGEGGGGEGRGGKREGEWREGRRGEGEGGGAMDGMMGLTSRWTTAGLIAVTSTKPYR